MHPLMKHREKWGPHSLEWPQPVISKHVLKFRVLYAIEKTAWCFLSLLAQCFLFICERGDRAPHACLQMTREWLLRLPAWGGKMRCYSQWMRSVEKVGDETKMCLSMPTGVLTLLQASIAFCQERKLKGHPFYIFPGFGFVRLHVAPSPFRSAAILRRCWEGSLPAGVHRRQETDSVSLRWAWRCQTAHSQLVLQSRGEGHVEFRARAMTDGCKGNLLSAAALPVHSPLTSNGPERGPKTASTKDSDHALPKNQPENVLCNAANSKLALASLWAKRNL